jgi:hypothetical protein
MMQDLDWVSLSFPNYYHACGESCEKECGLTDGRYIGCPERAVPDGSADGPAEL